jgi:hypothetical protein
MVDQTLSDHPFTSAEKLAVALAQKVIERERFIPGATSFVIASRVIYKLRDRFTFVEKDRGSKD